MSKIVSLISCDTYEKEKVKSVLKKSLENLGGIEKYINKGDKVLLKVNLLMKKKPEVAATTHPAFVLALAEILKDYGAIVIIGDSPGGPFTEKTLAGIYSVTGMEEAANESGAKLNFNTASFECNNPNGHILKKLVLTDMLNDVDKVISVSKLKTHGMMTFTGAVKNMFGTVPGVIKAEYHLTMPDYASFADALLDIYENVNPVLSFMDGVIGMEGAGPSGGDARKLNCILASSSGIHLDKTACSIISLPFENVPLIKQAVLRGMCTNDLSDVNITGDSIDDFKVTDFKIPESEKKDLSFNMPKFLKRFYNIALKPRPKFDHSKCISCGVCAENCPAKIIDMENNKPKANIDKCIRCYCCQELCPAKAVEIHKPKALSVVEKVFN